MGPERKSGATLDCCRFACAMLTLSDTQKVGLVMTSFGAFCTTFGILLMMDRGLLALGNILFVTGSVLLVGLDRASSFFLEQSRLKGSVCFFGGIVFVLIKWPILGLLVEVFGFVNLFGNSFPWLLVILRNVPVLGTLHSLPVISPFLDWVSGVVASDGSNKAE